MLKITSMLQTRFHRELATSAWMERLARRVEAALEANGGYETSDGEGEVLSQYNEERFMGPASLVKYRFVVDIEVARRESPEKDFYRCSLRFRPDTEAFVCEEEFVDTPQSRAADLQAQRERDAKVDEQAQRLREQCEGRQAIYLEKGAIRVRVSNIRAVEEAICADVEEVPTRGLPVGWLEELHAGKPRPLRWSVGARPERGSFTPDFWSGPPHVAWQLHFDPLLVRAIVDLAAQWPDDLPALARYCDVGRLFMERK